MSETAALPLSLSEVPLLERDGEIAALDALVKRAAAGEAGVALVEGPAGIGKSRLLMEARQRAARAGFRELLARGGVLEREYAFGVVRQLFEPVLLESETRARALAGAADPARAVFEPQADSGADDPSFALLHGLYWATVNLTGDGPLLIAVDDVHCCDAASLRFLAYLVRRLEGLPVLVACNLRSSEPEAESTALSEIAGAPLTVTIEPRALSRSAAADLVRARLGEDPDERFAIACHGATMGNPLLLCELLKSLEAEGVRPDAEHADQVAELRPRAVSRAVLTRLARLPEEAVKVARAVAILGDGAALATVAALAGLSEDAARAGAAALVQAEILQAQGGAASLGFAHPLVGAIVYDEAAPPALEREHGRAAELLAVAGAPDEQVAAHLLAVSSRGEPWVVETLRKAASASLKKGAAESAVKYLARAFAEPPPPERRAEVLVELGRADALTSGPAAVEHLTEGRDLLDDPVDRAGVARTLASVLLLRGQTAEAATVARRAAAELAHDDEGLRSALEAFEHMAVFFGAGDPESLRRLERHRAGPIGDCVGAKALAVLAARQWAYSGGSSEDCAERTLEALAGGELIEVDNGLMALFAIATLVRADRAEALDALELALELAHRRGSLLAKSTLSWCVGFTKLRWGDLAEAEEAFRTAIDEFARWGSGPELGSTDSVALLALTLRERGGLTEARRMLERVRDPGDRSDSARVWLDCQLELLVAEGRFEDAVRVADDAAERFAYLRFPIDTPWRQHKALALDGLGRRDEARELAREDLALARSWGAPGAVARALRVLGTLAREDGLDQLREAVEVVEGSPARLEHAKALAALGAGLRRARHAREARPPLRLALELADLCGAGGLVEAVRSELRAAGARPRTTALTGIEALTASERRVAILAAEGRTNRQIAQLLFVVPKTVEVHLSNAYRKLGIRSRRELPDLLGG